MTLPISHSPAEEAAEQVSRNHPVVRLKPKAEARAIRHGFPWVYADELVTDHRTQGLAPGALAILQDGERRDLGLREVGDANRADLAGLHLGIQRGGDVAYNEHQWHGLSGRQCHDHGHPDL